MTGGAYVKITFSPSYRRYARRLIGCPHRVDICCYHGALIYRSFGGFDSVPVFPNP
jgi:hypothetical protein